MTRFLLTALSLEVVLLFVEKSTFQMLQLSRSTVKSY